MEERLILKSAEAKDNNNNSTTDLRGKFYEESKKLWKLSFPALLSRVTLFGTYVVTQAFIGHMGELELAAYAVIQTVCVRFAFGVLLGMSSATDTLCGQAFGAKQYHMLGIYLQRSLIINLGSATLTLPIFILATPIFRLLGEGEDIAEVSGYISLWFIPMVYFLAFHLTIQNYLQAQLKNSIVGWVSAISFVLHCLMSWIFVSILNWGIAGAMSAMIGSAWLILIAEFVYVLGGWCPDTWKGFTWACFSDLFPVLKLSVSSGVMLCLELWYNAILVILAGHMKDAATEISAFSICLNVTSLQFTLCAGFLVAISVRVANELGRGSAKAALFSIRVTLSTSIAIGVFFSILCLVFGHQLGYLFTTEMDVGETVSQLSILVAFSIFLNSIQAVLSGIAVGAGRQGIVAFINIGCYYWVGVPTGVLLAYTVHLQVKGIWIGMIIGVLMQSLVLGYIIMWRTDWDEEVRKASDRLSRLFLRNATESTTSLEERLI